MEQFCARKRLIVAHELVHLLIDGRLLPIGTHFPLAKTPQVIDGVEVRAAVGQPQEANVQILGQRLGLLIGVGGVFIQKQGHWPGAIVPTNKIQKFLELQPAMTHAFHEQQVTAT